MNHRFLTEAEVEELTGSPQTATQKKILKANNIYFVERNDGKIRVCWYHVEHPNLVQSNDDGINWDAA